MTINKGKKSLGLYIHIPFCLRKCAYCDFCSFDNLDEGERRVYADALVRQIESWRQRCEGYSVDTVFFGGGTPTLMPISAFDRIFEALHRNFSIEAGAEVSMECNPATGGEEYFRELRRLGVNRLSIGCQSLDDGELRKIGRLHSSADFVDTYGAARRAGFDNINADLIYGLPEQSTEKFLSTVRGFCSLAPEHISAYCLKVEEGTPFGKMGGSLILPDEDAQFEMYSRGREMLEGAGYGRYEISNFARPGYESRHNLKYWNCDEYLGLGLAAHSYFGGERFACHRDMARYIVGEYLEGEPIKIDSDESETEYVMLRMRLREGLRFDEYSERFGRDAREKYGERFAPFVKSGHVISDGESFVFSEEGIFVSNYILSSVLDL